VYFNVSYDREFDELMMFLKAKYGSKILDIEGIGKQLDMNNFSKEFMSNINTTADISVDSNANVDSRDIIAYNVELPKPFFRFNSYYLLWKKLKKIFGHLEANRIIEMQVSGDIYIHDFHNVGTSYCFNFSTYDIMLMGLPMIRKIVSIAPKHLYAFKSQLEQFIVIAANSILGASGVADTLIVMAHYVEKILKTKSDAGFKFMTEEDCWRYVKETLISFIYTLNQPQRGGNQSPFTNISLFDRPFLEAMFKDGAYLSPETGEYPNIDIVMALQELFIDTINEEMDRTPITFPVTTACFVVDDENNILDDAFLTMISEKNIKYGFINIYCGKSSTLSSCCFHKSQTAGVSYDNKYEIDTFENLYLKYKDKEIMIPNHVSKNGFSEGRIVRVPKDNKKMYKITMANNNEIIVTEDHIHPTPDGDKKTIRLKPGDEILYKNTIIAVNGHIKITSIEDYPDNPEFVYCFEMKNPLNPYFILPTGMITHNCRLRSDVTSEYFNSIGGSSVKIGSIGVVTINLPRLAVKCEKNADKFYEQLTELVYITGKINFAKRQLLQKRIDNGNIPLYTHGFMDLKKQYSTTGLNGINEACELMGYNIIEENGQTFVTNVLTIINDVVEKMQKMYKSAHNLEQIPGESVSVKLAEKDSIMGYNPTGYLLYSNQFIPLTVKADMLDRIRLQGLYDKSLSGGGILHVNVGERIEDPELIKELIKICAKMGVIYHAINYNIQRCKNGHMTVGTNGKCTICGAEIVDSYTRVVGFLTSTKNWGKVRRTVDYPNRHFYSDITIN
jgi:anaerobic ribonucleoside-triphosphate reductase